MRRERPEPHPDANPNPNPNPTPDPNPDPNPSPIPDQVRRVRPISTRAASAPSTLPRGARTAARQILTLSLTISLSLNLTLTLTLTLTRCADRFEADWPVGCWRVPAVQAIDRACSDPSASSFLKPAQEVFTELRQPKKLRIFHAQIGGQP